MNKNFTPVAESRPFWSGKNRFLTLLIAVPLMFFTVAPSAWAKEHTITIYFAGTGTPTNAWDGANSAWGSRSLIPVLYNHDAGTASSAPYDPALTQHKIHVAGVGTKGDYRNQPGYCNPLESLYQKKDPHNLVQEASLDDIPCRTWKATVDEGLNSLEHILETKLQNNWDTAVLNLVGHSRGAVSVLWLIRDISAKLEDPDFNPAVTELDRITKINAIVMDPVPGIDTTQGYEDYGDVDNAYMGWDVFTVNSNVDKLVAIYALDERSARFEPVVPMYDETQTQTLMFAVRGSHQTMVGNKQWGGHDTGTVLAVPYKGVFTDGQNLYTDDDLLVVYKTVGITAMRLLHGSEWGGVDFKDVGDHTSPAYNLLGTLCHLHEDDNWLDGDNCKSNFLLWSWQMHHDEFFEDPHPEASLYWDRMRGLGYVPFDDLSGFEDNDCHWKKWEYAIDTYRCAVVMKGGGAWKEGLEEQDGSEYPGLPDWYRNYVPLLGETDSSRYGTWDKILLLAEGDEDDDGVGDDLDVCPATDYGDLVDTSGCSDTQVDGDGDGYCDPDAPSVGPSACIGEDNCPGIDNPLQENYDGDAYGNVCDNCPGHTNPEQYDVDGDGVGNLCDNCSLVFNVDQADGEGDLDGVGDGIGNACDTGTSVSAFDDFFNTLEDEDRNIVAPGILSNDTEADGAALTAVQETLAASIGSLVVSSNGAVDFTPLADYCGPDLFSYHADNGTDISNTAGIFVGVTCVNDQPSFDHDGDQQAMDSWFTQMISGFAIGYPGGGADEAGQRLSYIVTNDNESLFFMQPRILPDGMLVFKTRLNVSGTATVTVQVKDDGGTANGGIDTSEPDTFIISVGRVNDAPVAVDNNYTLDEDTGLAGNVITDNTGEGVDNDVDGDTMRMFSNTDVSHGTLAISPDGGFTYTPNPDYCGPDSFTYVITDDPPITPDPGPLQSEPATVDILVTCVNDPPEVTSVTPALQTTDYSDFIGTVSITVEDVDDTATTLTETNEPPLSEAGLSLTSMGCTIATTESPEEDGSICSWTYDGQVLDPGDNDYSILFIPADHEATGVVTGTHVLSTEVEDATVQLAGDNDVAAKVIEDGGNSGVFSLFFSAWETTDPEDFSHGNSAVPGDLNEMVPFMTLIPVGPGGPVEAVSCEFTAPPPDPEEGYAQVALFECTFDDVPVNTYEILAFVDGTSDTTRYYAGSDEDVFTVYDPSLGFITGGGWFYWPDTCSRDNPEDEDCNGVYLGDKTNFGFNLKYNKKRKNTLGSVLMMRHTITDEVYKVKSNALQEMAVGDAEDDDGPYGWAAISGKSTFLEPGLENTGGNPFLMYVEDHGEQGCGQDPVDEFWIEVKSRDGLELLQLNGPEPADNDPDNDPPLDGEDEPIECGNIYVPHKADNEGKGKDKK